jgi:DNA processing protein
LQVLGKGPDFVYPRGHYKLFEQICDPGLLVSEFMPGTRAAPHHFPRRNRVLAVLTPTTVVVEAGRRSGSLITVDHALDLGREGWVVPGPIDTATCDRSNRLLVDGACPLTNIDEFVLEAVGGVDTRAELSRGPGSGPEPLVWAALGEETFMVNELATRAGLPVPRALAALTTMELHGRVGRVAGMRFRRAA